MTDKIDPIRPTDENARALAASLVRNARFGSLGVLDPATSFPMVTRIATLWLDGAPHVLISTLSAHTTALSQDPRCSLLLGEPADKGDPLTHPRLTLQCRAKDADKAALKEAWLHAIPKAKLYYDFTDFRMMRLAVEDAHLNGGFGKAFHLTPEDLPT